MHVHDIATPMDYPAPVIVEQVKPWNEQYLLKAFLSPAGECFWMETIA